MGAETLTVTPNTMHALDLLAERARHELAMTAYPAKSWVKPLPGRSPSDVIDVLIVGAGQSGMACALALRRDGIDNVLLIDENPEGTEGPWETYARMIELRTPKFTVGMDMGIPSLTAQAWFETKYGREAWAAITRVPRHDWMNYLRWYRRVLDLPIRNELRVTGIEPAEGCLRVMTAGRDGAGALLARRVILATGYDGSGHWQIPEFIRSAVAPERLLHSNQVFDCAALRGLRVGILGHGASAFDTAGALLEAGAHSVDLCYRRQQIPTINPHRWIESAGFLKHYPELPDEIRWQTAYHFETADQPPTQRSFDNASRHANFRRHPGTPWLRVEDNGRTVTVHTPHTVFEFDFIIAATGSQPDLAARPELAAIESQILRWADVYQPPPDLVNPVLGLYPYLGPHYELRERTPGSAPWLSQIHAYSFAAYVSQGPHSTSISGHRHSIPRMVRAITRSFFLEQQGTLVASLKAYDEAELVIPDASTPATIEPRAA
jgi:cation diffusion facilitator CzcD-associated flavoprotein CzcO